MQPGETTLRRLQPSDPEYAVEFVDAVLRSALERRASDIHLQPRAEGLELAFRLDGVLVPLGTFPRGDDSDPVMRLKVLAGLLTYRTGQPQEGRLRKAPQGVEMRLSTFPTVHGERAVVRLFAAERHLGELEELGLPERIVDQLASLTEQRDGAVLMTGPAGSGKTTTLYACLRRIAAATDARRSVLTLEDPIESVLEGISQSQLDPGLGMTLDAALRSILRQDPEVILVGEVRDPATAEAALQASLTGHLVFSSLHAGDIATALRRLVEMRIPPYLLRSGIRAICSQRLLRRLCECREAIPPAQAGLPVRRAWQPVGCEQCLGTGYRGRVPIAEMLRLDEESAAAALVAEAIDTQRPASELYAAAITAGMQPLRQSALAQVEAGATSPAEMHRVLGSRALGPS